MKKIAIAIAVFVVIIAIACFKITDSTPYPNLPFYSNALNAISETVSTWNVDSNIVTAGWAKVNLQPSFTTPIAIDAHRNGKHYDGVHDSVFVRAIVFKQGNKKFAYVSADLLIIPPTVTGLLNEALKEVSIYPDHLYLTATHTHSSIGAWYPSIVGEVFAGKFNPEVPKHITNCIIKAIQKASENCDTVSMGYKEIATSGLVFNRLVKDKGKVDSLLRVIKLEKKNGERACLFHYAAHATLFHQSMMQLSGDWPGLLVQQLDSLHPNTFHCFSAGAVGSHGPVECANNQEANAKCIKDGLYSYLYPAFDSLPTTSIQKLNAARKNIPLREPNLRITSFLSLRPWLFNRLFGNEPVHIQMMQLNNILLTGLPCDFSGELMHDLDIEAKRQQKHLSVTSFNGGYIGYVTDDRWYSLDAYETRTMGWFSPGTGRYFSELVKACLLAKKDADNK